MTTRILFEHVAVRCFRNITALDLEPAVRVNVIAGDNGQGKTSVLEALYFVATSRSFRAEKLRELLQEGAELSTVRATLREDGQRREQRAALGPRTRSVSIDGKRAARLAAYATRTPVVVFHPGDLLVATGPASVRRRLLDRVSLFVDPASADHRLRYERAMRARQNLLEQGGARGAGLEAFEQLMADHGAALGRARARAAEQLGRVLSGTFARMAAPGLQLTARFVPGAPDAPEELARALAERRDRDLRRRSATVGPHRDELELEIDGRSVRRHASQGQQRILTLAIKAAELECVREARGAHPVLLLDDVSSELDPSRTGAVYDFLRETQNQVFVTTTRPELFSTPGIEPGERADWTLQDGALSAAPRSA